MSQFPKCEHGKGDAMGFEPCELCRIAELEDEIERLQAIVDKLPAEKILRACDYIENAENSAAPNVRTQQAMAPGEIEECLGILIDCREAAEAKED